jgi:hypothetical protein
MFSVGDKIGDSKDNWRELIERMGEERYTKAVLH